MTQLWTLMRKLRELRRNETLSRAQLEELKLARFRQLVRHVGQRSPYYAQIIGERRIDVDSCIPGDFPLLTKSILMENFDRIVTDRRLTRQGIAEFLTRSTDPNDLLLGEYRILHTSGSSGEVGYFVYSQADWGRGMAQLARGRRTSPKRRRFGRWRMAFYGATGGHFTGVSIATSGRRSIARLFVDVGTFEINSPLPQVIEQLNAFRPDLLSGYTTALKILAGKQREGLLRISPVAVSASGEPVTDADKALLSKTFGCEVVNVYACTEHLMMGVCGSHEPAMTLYDDDLIYEFHDDHSVVTNLFNETLPLIRYRMSDILRPLAQAGASPYPAISGLVGRTEILPAFLNRDGAEDFISPHTINEIFVAGVVRFQMHRVSATRFRFLVCLDPSLDEGQRAAALHAVRARLAEILEQKLMSNVAFDVAAVEDLPPDPRTRKFRLIVDVSNETGGENAGAAASAGRNAPAVSRSFTREVR